MNATMTISAPAGKCCERCGRPASYRKDAAGFLVQELCRTCNPSHYPAMPKPFDWLPKLVAFTGLAMSGKTTCADWMRDKFGFVRLSFAGPIKRMIATLTDERDKNAMPDALCGQTLRHAYQTLGTEWGRNLIGHDIWLRAARHDIERYRGGCAGITLDDARFCNEAQLIRDMGGVVIRLHRPGLEQMQHASEAGISRALVDAEIEASTSEELIERLDVVLTRIKA